MAAEVRAHPELADLPLAVVSEPGPRAAVLSVSPRAVQQGVHPGSTLAHARSICAELRARVASPALEAAARAALLDVALSTSPRVEASAPRTGARAGEAAVLLDAGGVGPLFRSEAGLANALTARAAALGLPAVAAVAKTRALARLAARRLAVCEGPGATCVVEPGRERAFLAPLPVDLIDPGDALAQTLTRFGIHRLGALLDLPAHTLATRLGAEARARVARLRGDAREPPLPAPDDTRIEEALDLEAPVDNLEPLAFVLRGMLSRLLGRLAVRQLACGELELRLETAGGGRSARRIALAAPTRELRVLLRRLRLVLEATPPDAPVEAVALATDGQPRRDDQLDLFRPAGPAPAALDTLLAELEALCGPDRIGHPVLPDTHHPGAFAQHPFT
ncbi:MAG: hypothetical protein QNK03_24385, partial [Myxococcota bacterium]|nr:hypothetical protein [Myxococcota bacterium]